MLLNTDKNADKLEISYTAISEIWQLIKLNMHDSEIPFPSIKPKRNEIRASKTYTQMSISFFINNQKNKQKKQFSSTPD